VGHTSLHAELASGDLIESSHLGVYGVVLKPPFIKPARAIMSLRENGGFTVVKRMEVLNDIMATYQW